MATIASKTTRSAGFRSLDEEVHVDSVPVTGTVPAWLQGTLVRVTPALMDGAGYFKIFTRISLPQLRPALSALGIITFTQTWNYYFQARVLLEPQDSMTLPVAMDVLRGYLAEGNLALVMAAMSMAVLPVIILFLLAQKLVIEGVTMSGIKN